MFKAHYCHQIIGRFGQVILAYVSWSIFRDYITMKMQTSPITYQGFQIIFLQDNATIFSTAYMIQNFFRRRIRYITAMVFIVWTMIFIVMWPTLASAMSGYDGILNARIETNGILVPYSDYKQADCFELVNDGFRLGLASNYTLCGVNVAQMKEGEIRTCVTHALGDDSPELCNQFDGFEACKPLSSTSIIIARLVVTGSC